MSGPKSGRLVLCVAMLALPSIAFDRASGADDGCVDAVCEFNVPVPPLVTRWRPVVDEVAPRAWAAEGLQLNVTRSTRAGTFFLVSDPIIAPAEGSLSVTLSARGDVDRFVLLVREEGFAGATERPESGDTVVAFPATSAPTFVSAPWRRIHDDALTVRVFLRAEMDAGGTGAIEFGSPYFGPDTTVWRVGRDSPPAGHGPRFETRFTSAGVRTVFATSDGVDREFRADVPELPLVANVTFHASPIVPGAVRADASRTTDPFAPPRLRNGAFDEGATGWRLDPNELGRVTRLEGTDGGLTLLVGPGHEGGAVWAFQRVPLDPGRETDLVWRATDDRGIAAYALVIAEQSGARHEIVARPGGGAGAGGAFRFTPESMSAMIQLRVLLAPNATAVVRFEEVQILPAHRYEWRLDDVVLEGAEGPFVDVSATREAGPRVSVAVRGGARPVARAEAPVPAHVPGDIEAALLGEPFVERVGARAWLDATPTAAPFDAFQPLPFWEHWSPEDEEAPGGVLVEHDAREVAVSVGPRADNSVGGGVIRHVPPFVVPGEHILAVTYATEGRTDRMHLAVRFHDGAGRLLSAVDAKFPPSETPRRALTRVVAPEGYVDVVVALRVVVPANATGGARFSDVSLAPRLEYVWSTEAVHSEPGSPLAFALIGHEAPLNWRIIATTPGGLTVVHSGRTAFLSTAVPFATLSRGVATVWNGTWVSPAARLLIEGPLGAASSGDTGRVETEAFVPGEYRFVALDGSGGRRIVSEATISDRAGLGNAAFSAIRGTPFIVHAAFPNPELVAASLVLDRGMGAIHIPLRYLEPTGPWTGTWSVSLSEVPGARHAVWRLVDRAGDSADVPVTVRIAMAPGDVPNGVLALVGLGAVAIIVARRRA